MTEDLKDIWHKAEFYKSCLCGSYFVKGNDHLRVLSEIGYAERVLPLGR